MRTSAPMNDQSVYCEQILWLGVRDDFRNWLIRAA